MPARPALLALSVLSLASADVDVTRAATADIKDRQWINEPFRQGQGPGWPSVATPWRTRVMAGARAPVHLKRKLRRPIYISVSAAQTHAAKAARC